MVDPSPPRQSGLAQSTDRIVAGLVEGLEPVRRIPRLRTVLAAIGVLWGGAALARWLGEGARTDTLRADPGFTLIVLGLALLAGGALVMATATSVPGRERAARWGRRLAWGGAVVGCALAPAWVLIEAGGGSLWPRQEDFLCVRGTLRVAVLPGLAALGFVFWAAPRRPARVALLSALGAAALGAVAIHATCPVSGARHWVLGHALAPLQVVAVVALPVAAFAFWYRKRA